MDKDDIEAGGAASPDRRTLIRDLAVFQVKVVVDGFRDLLLVPLSLVAGLIGLLSPGRRRGSEFYDLLRLGRRTERWINLFAAAERLHGPQPDDENFGDTDIDQFAGRIESFIVDEYRKGGLTQQARRRLDEAIDRLQSAARRKG